MGAHKQFLLMVCIELAQTDHYETRPDLEW